MNLCKVRTGMKLVPAGPFLMGSEGWGEFEGPIHEIHLDDFWIDETLVTNKEFALFADTTGYKTDAERSGSAWGYRDCQFSNIEGLSWRSYASSSRENHPVVLASWNDAGVYAQWVGKRLPTEAEWEKAARGGLTGTSYPWGDCQPDARNCNFAQPPNNIPPTTEVRTCLPNGYGIYDMAGNVWQWCADWYEGNYYAESPYQNPLGPPVGSLRVRRGGGWNILQPFRLRSANRGALDPFFATPNIGFRCCL